MANFVFVLATLLATSYAFVEVNGGNGGIEGIRNKLEVRFGPRAYGGGASAASSVGGSRNDLYASSTVNAAPYHYQAPPVYAPNHPPAHYRQEAPVYAPYYEPEVNPYEEAAHYHEEPPRPLAHQQRQPRHPAPLHSSASATAQGRGAQAVASVGSPIYARPSAPALREHAPPAPPTRPNMGLDNFKGRNVALSQSRNPGNRFGRFGGAHAGGIASASASSGLHGPNSYAASAGTYANDGYGRESGAYTRSTSSKDVVEEGNADDDHYYKAGTYGKEADENLLEAYNMDDEDIEQTDNVYRKKKRGENYKLSYNKSDRESGSDVLEKDHSSSRFSKNVKLFNENVDEKYNKEGNGISKTENYSNSKQIEEEDEDAFDSDGFGKAAPAIPPRAAPAILPRAASVTPTPSANHQMASATNSVSNGATSSAASAVGQNY